MARSGTSERRSVAFAPGFGTSARLAVDQVKAIVLPVGRLGSIRRRTRTPYSRYRSRRSFAFESDPTAPMKVVEAPRLDIWSAKFVAFPPRQRIEPGNLRLHIARREILHRGCDQVDNSVADRDDARRSRTHLSRPPESLALQLLDDELVVRRPTASRAEQTSVRISDRVGSFPPAVAAQRVRRRHRLPQKKSSSVSFLSARRGDSAGGTSLKSSLDSDFCCDRLPVRRAFSSQP